MKLLKGIAVVLVVASLLAIVILASLLLGDTIDFQTTIKNMIPFVIVCIVSMGTFVVIDEKCHNQ